VNEIEESIKRVEAIIPASLRKLQERIDRIIPPFVQQLNYKSQGLNKAFEPFLNNLNTTMVKIAKSAERWQIARKEDVTVMAENGWYPNWFTFVYFPEEKPTSVDEMMINHLNEHWEEITEKILELCPNRKHILENAFELHKEGNYIASISLFLSQADGICCEVLKSFLFTGNTTEERLKELIEKGEIEATMFTDVFLEPFKLKNHYNAGMLKSSLKAKNKAPNRNGILHGYRKHLDYGTEINSLKSFSLLSFIVYTTKDLING